MVAKGFKAQPVCGNDLSNSELVIGELNHLHNYSKQYLAGAAYKGITYDEGDDSDETTVKFVACGADEELDSDMNYSLCKSTGSVPLAQSSQNYKYV